MKSNVINFIEHPTSGCQSVQLKNDLITSSNECVHYLFRYNSNCTQVRYKRAPCFGRHVKPLAPAAFAIVSTHQSALGPRGGLCHVLLVSNPQGRPMPQQWGH
jgi:hypothetical protein